MKIETSAVWSELDLIGILSTAYDVSAVEHHKHIQQTFVDVTYP